MPGIPDDAYIVRGGKGDPPTSGSVQSGSYGATEEDAARGVPHGAYRATTAGEIREGGGRVEYRPEEDGNYGTNYQHVDFEVGEGSQPFGERKENPWDRSERWHGPDYEGPDREIDFGQAEPTATRDAGHSFSPTDEENMGKIDAAMKSDGAAESEGHAVPDQQATTEPPRTPEIE